MFFAGYCTAGKTYKRLYEPAFVVYVLIFHTVEHLGAECCPKLGSLPKYGNESGGSRRDQMDESLELSEPIAF